MESIIPGRTESERGRGHSTIKTVLFAAAGSAVLFGTLAFSPSPPHHPIL